MTRDNPKCGMIKLSDIEISYSDYTVLQNVNYVFQRDRCYILQGESGVGKTTLLNLIAGYIEPKRGEIVRTCGSRVDYMFQDLLAFSNATVLENLALKYYATHQEEIWDLELVKAKHDELLCRFKIDSLLHRKVSSLSGGEKQRVLLAGMLVSDADILLMDEPLASLDPENRLLIAELVGICIPDHVVIIASHIPMQTSYPVQTLEIKDGYLYEK